MGSKNIGGGHTLGIAVGIITLAILLLAGGVHAENMIWDESQGTTLPFTWNITNFYGFNVEETGTENLTVLQTDLNTDQRTIGAGNLTYDTAAQAKKLNVVTALNLTDNQAMTDKGLEQAAPGKAFDNGEYYILNWQAQRYVAVNRKVNKLARLIIEQGPSEKKTMLKGETWDIGGGWALLFNSIDARAVPKQIEISLYKDGIKKDDRVLSAGSDYARPIYTYVEKSIGGESDVPLFVTYVDSIFSGKNSEIVQFSCTWAVSTSIDVIQSDSTYGIFRDAMVAGNSVSLNNAVTPLTLSPDAAINLMGNVKFKVIDNSTSLKFYPTDEPRLNITSSLASIPAGAPVNVIFTVTSGGSPIGDAEVYLSGAAAGRGITDMSGKANMSITAAYDGNITVDAGKAGYTNSTAVIHAYALPTSAIDSWVLEENYVLNLTDIDVKVYPAQARFQLSKESVLVKESFMEQGGVFEYCPNLCIFNATVDAIFNGTKGIIVRLVNVNQYSETTGTPLLKDAVHLFKSGNLTGISWLLDEGYDLRMMDIDISYLPLVWLELLKNHTVMDDAILSIGEKYTYGASPNSTVLIALVDVIFNGETSSIVKLVEAYQFSETTGAVLLNNSTHSYISGVITRNDLPLYEGYNLSVIGIDRYAYPRRAWLRLFKNDAMMDEKIVTTGDIYSYRNQSKTLVYAEISSIFAGRPLSAVQFRNVTQYAEINSSELIRGATYTFALNGAPLPISIPSVIPAPAYGYEVRGCPADGDNGVLNLSPPVTWTPQNFAGFYYDLDNNLGKEQLQILQPDMISSRTISKGNLTYTTTAQPKMLNVVKYAFRGDVNDAAMSGLAKTGQGQGFENGSYYVTGWQGGKYMALNGRVDRLAEIIIEHGSSFTGKKTLAIGDTWDIGGNWTLTVQSIDVRSSPRQAWLVLARDGIKKEDFFAFDKHICTYIEKSISNESDIPLFLTYIDSVFAGATTDLMQLRYTWAVNASIVEIRSDEIYGIFTDAEVTPSKTLKLRNSKNVLNLTPGSTIDLTGPLKFRVADKEDLRLIPVAVRRQTGTEDVRGAIWNETPIDGFGGIGSGGIWNATNFAGFFYDQDNDVGKEEMQVLQTDMYANQRTIYKNNLVYTTSSQEVSFEHSGFGSYQVIGFMADKYFAGYTTGSEPSGNNAKSTIGSGQLHKVLLDDDEKRTVSEGGTLTLQEGYVLKITAVDFVAGAGQVRITLLKDRSEVDSDVVAGNEDYYYTKKVGNVSDLPVIAVHFDSVFRGREINAVFIRGVFQISESYTQVKSGSKYGAMEITGASSSGITMENNDTIDLSPGSTSDVMGNIKFRVADNDTLRFYPFVQKTVIPDITPPTSITDLYNLTYAPTYIFWKWTDPYDYDFDHVEVYLNGAFKGNVAKGIQFYIATDLTADTQYELGTRTSDVNGNVNQTWVNWTARTALAILVIPLPIDRVTNMMNATVTITSPMGNVTVTIPNGTLATDINGNPLENISIESTTILPSNTGAALSADERKIGEEVVILEPEGAVFNPPIQIRFNYSKPLPDGISEDSFEVRFFDASTNKWVSLPVIERNTTLNYIVANVTHFSTFALLGRMPTPSTTITTSHGSSGDGGGGGGGPSGENFTNIEVRENYDLHIFKDQVTSYRYTNRSNPVMFINVTGNINAGEINAAVEVLRNTSTLIKSPTPAPGIIYKNVNIWVGTTGFAIPKNIKTAAIKFTVLNTWLENNRLAAGEVRMVRWDGSKWVILDTAVNEKGDTNTFFEATTDTFSPFAITGLKEIPKVVSAVGTGTMTVPAATPIASLTEKMPEFEFVLVMVTLLALYILGRKRR